MTLLQLQSYNTITPSQLYQWANENVQPNQWWLSLDFVTQENPVTTVEIDEIVTYGGYSDIRALHVSQAEIENPKWLKVTMPTAMIAPPILPATLISNYNLETIETPPASKPTSQPEMTSEQRKGCGSIIALAAIVSLWILGRFGSLNFAIWCVPIILFFAIIFWATCFPKSFEKYNTTPKKPTKNKPASKRATMVQSGLCLIGLVYIVWNIWPIIKTSYQDEQKNQSEISAANTSVKSTVGEYAISGDNFTGFIRSDDWEKSFELASDTEAFSRFFLQCAMSKRATLFKAGEAVILVEVDGLFGEKVRIRRKGETVSYWTVGNSIR